MNAAGTFIPDDRLAPVLSVFDASGSEDLLATDRDGGPGDCGPRGVDSVSHFCWDAYLNLSLAAGSYILALTEDDNSANGPTLADGFFRAGQGNFTPLVFGGPPDSSFILADGSQRTDTWAVDLIGVNVPVSSVPEPGSATLLLLCGAAMFLKSRNCFRERFFGPMIRLPGVAAQEGL